MKKLSALLSLSLAALFATGISTAEAGTRNLWPDRFTLSAIDQSMADAQTKAMRDFSRLRAIGGCAIYESEVSLPVGTRITRFEVNASLSKEDHIIANLFYDYFGGFGPEAAAILNLSGENSHAWYSGQLWAPNVYPGRRYWVFLNICGSATVKGVRVSYR